DIGVTGVQTCALPISVTRKGRGEEYFASSAKFAGLTANSSKRQSSDRSQAESSCPQSPQQYRYPVADQQADGVTHGSRLQVHPSIFSVRAASARCLQNQR